MQINIPSVDIFEVLLRLNELEKNVCITRSETSHGWNTILAWNPAEIFIGDHNAQELEAFTARQQSESRLTIGYMSYDFGAQQHGVSLNTLNDVKTPSVYAAGFDSCIGFEDGVTTLYTNDASFADEVKKILARPMPSLPDEIYQQAPKAMQSRDWYKQAFAKVQNHILDGDVYQINLTHRLEGTAKASGRRIFCKLAQNSNVDFQAYIEANSFEIISLSPERFIKISDGRIETMPIKGTRPRAGNKVDDQRLEVELRGSPKDQAELNMITDLLRNDLGKICQTGSVKVTEHRKITAYPTVWHAHSKIEGELLPGISPMAALVSVSPGGSITGCPKKRAIEIIDEVEAVSRGVYTGTIFTLTPSNQLDSSIAIRTMVKSGERIYLSVGGGIVYDSAEADEYQESLDKAASFLLGSKSLDNDI